MKFFNTLGRNLQEFKPITSNKVGIYTCGPTVYDYAHIGNLRAYLFADILRRTLQQNGFDVTQIMNITDVGHLTSDEDTGEDKMEKGAAREKMTVWQIAEKYANQFKEDLNKLNIEEPTKFVKATDHIAEQIDFIKILEEKGYTYKTTDGIYFDTAKMPDYGQIACLNLEDQIAGARIEANPEKKNPADFALWKFSPKNTKRQMEWESPWGTGFPGWHIECSAMARKYLGDQFDIHTGGVDHITVHHCNEIAQGEAATGMVPARYWLHSEFLTIEGSKMAKSLGNIYTLSNLIDKGYDPIALRYLSLTAHYRSKLNFTWKGLDAASETLRSIKRLKDVEQQIDEDEREKAFQQALEALNTDLDTPKALAILHAANDYKLWLKFEPIFALNLEVEKEIPKDVETLAKQRDEARKSGDYDKSDKLREEIGKLGYIVEDTPLGYKLYQK